MTSRGTQFTYTENLNISKTKQDSEKLKRHLNLSENVVPLRLKTDLRGTLTVETDFKSDLHRISTE